MGAISVPSEETALRRAGPLAMKSAFASFSIAGDSEFQIRRHLAHTWCFKEHNICKKCKVENRGALQFDLVATSWSGAAPLLVDFIDRRLKNSPKGMRMIFWQGRQEEAITG